VGVGSGLGRHVTTATGVFVGVGVTVETREPQPLSGSAVAPIRARKTTNPCLVILI
jgi:hypothetical protein